MDDAEMEDPINPGKAGREDSIHLTNSNAPVDRIKANAIYSYRVPSPHRVHVPPPAFTDAGESPITISRVLPQAGLDVDFLNEVDCTHLYDRNLMLNNSWSYDKRRSATEILPWLYLGPMTVARDREALQREGITMILGVAHRSAFPSRMAMGPMKAADELGLDKELIEVADNTELIAAFPKAIQAINQHLVRTYQQGAPLPPLDASNAKAVKAPMHDSPFSNTTQSANDQYATGRVLVFCESGNERSAAVVAAYLMQMFDDVDHVKAIQMCNLRRFSTNFEDGLRQYLFSYYSILKARRDVTAMHTRAFKSMDMNKYSTHGKRHFDITLDKNDDLDVEMEEDIERFAGRDFAPFEDHEGLAGGLNPVDRPMATMKSGGWKKSDRS